MMLDFIRIVMCYPSTTNQLTVTPINIWLHSFSSIWRRIGVGQVAAALQDVLLLSWKIYLPNRSMALFHEYDVICKEYLNVFWQRKCYAKEPIPEFATSTLRNNVCLCAWVFVLLSCLAFNVFSYVVKPSTYDIIHIQRRPIPSLNLICVLLSHAGIVGAQKKRRKQSRSINGWNAYVQR